MLPTPDLGKAGIKYIGTGDLTTDDELPNMGNAALGVVTAHLKTWKELQGRSTTNGAS